MKNSRIVLNGQNYATPHTESVEIMMSHSVLAGSGVGPISTYGTSTDHFIRKTL